VRATLESIAYQSGDALRCFEEDTGLRAQSLQVDGGASANDFLMQFQADVLGIPIRRPEVLETTALGAAYLAGLAVGFWSDRREIAANWNEERRFEPRLEPAERARLWAGWRRAVAASRGWADPARRNAAGQDT
jgi:glycerol kinase